MTANEFEAVIEFQRSEIRQLENRLGLLDAFLTETLNFLKGQEQVNGRLEQSMQVFDPGYEWDNTGAYEN